MLKVLLVDDEPFILQGLQFLLDWKEEGFEIAGTAADGLEALQFLKENKVDLIIADINMPGMTGLDLLETIRREKISSAFFVILSGYAEFSYAQKAIRYECSYYMLKPVEKEELLSILRKVQTINENNLAKKQMNQKMERAYLSRNMIAVILGKFDSVNLEYVKENLRLSSNVRYVEIKLDESNLSEELTDEEKRTFQRDIFDYCLNFLEKDADHCVFDVSGHEKIYDIGFVYCDYMAECMGVEENEYFHQFLDYLRSNLSVSVNMLIGKKVEDISNITKSYTTVCMLHSFQGFQTKKDIQYYEEDVQVGVNSIILCKKDLDALVYAIEQNDQEKIVKCVNSFFEEMKNMELSEKIIHLNINYLLFQLIHLASEQDDGINQEEVLRLISESTFEKGIMRGSKEHITRFACEYGNYMVQLRRNASRGILGDIEREIQEHFAENITLKELGEKYFVNSAYLGQLFRKKYGQSFKDYLNVYRIEQACTRLLRTDDKIYDIAEAVGYHDLDYFVNRFIAVKGCTPAKFRRQNS
ncbi:MAG: response regulator [Lachnospiraceae bacterium]|nr:response regulator [Lachnospiraceae bacterium]